MELNQQIIFQVLVVFTIIQRLVELTISQANVKSLLSKGAIVVPEVNYLFMVLLHSSWLATLLYFAFYKPLHFTPLFFITGLFFFILGQALRITAIKTLGKRWTTKIVILPEQVAVKKGIFNWLRHPNYLGVCLEILALPLMASLYSVGVIFSLINGLILFFRIKKEESYLKKYNQYASLFKLQQLRDSQ